jgi:hypothetical protein
MSHQGSSAPSNESVVTQGGTKLKHEDACAILVTKVITLMSQLEEHVKLFKVLGDEHDWFNSLNATLLASSRHLITSILIHGDISTNRKIADFTCKNPLPIINIIRSHTISLPTYSDLADDPVHGKHFTPGKDSAADSLAQILLTQARILGLADFLYPPQHKPSPCEFGQRGGWWKTQEGSGAILCHRPASKQSNLPLKIMHAAFYEFNKKTTFSEDELEGFRSAAQDFAKSVTDPNKQEASIAARILEVLKRIFPVNSDHIWELEDNLDNKGRVDLIYKRILPKHYSQRFAGGKETADPYFYTNLIIIEFKLEDGHGGDAFMQLCRCFDIIVGQNPRYCETGVPIFLITISGMSDILILMTFGLISL